MSRSHGTGYPMFFMCAKARQIWWQDSGRTTLERRQHVTELTGRTRPTKRNGKGHPRKSWTTFEYRCTCGHVGWSSHIELERQAQRERIIE